MDFPYSGNRRREMGERFGYDPEVVLLESRYFGLQGLAHVFKGHDVCWIIVPGARRLHHNAMCRMIHYLL